MIYISTGGFYDKTADDASSELLKQGLKSIELSGGKYSPALLERLQRLLPDLKFQIHNYFPPSAEPFVFNLASLNPLIANQSVMHAKLALEWCGHLEADHYSVHAGFLFDPNVDELGKVISKKDLFDRDASIEKFISRISYLAELAQRQGVTLMIENNVLSAKNIHEFGCNPLLMCDPLECGEIMSLLPDNVQLLVDVAHLKVSANSLDFDRASMFESCHSWIGGYHLSDNDGLVDSNKPFSEDAWFWPYLKNNLDYYSIEVYLKQMEKLVVQKDMVKDKLGI